MRQKRVVLCVDSDFELSLHRIRIECWGYRVLKATTQQEASEALFDHAVDVVVIGSDNGAAILQSLWEISPEVRTMLISHTRAASEMKDIADVRLGVGMNEPIHVREWLKTLCARKRGPKPIGGNNCRLLVRERLAA